MAEDDHLPPPVRLVNFVSEDQLEEARRSRGARVDDGTAQRDRSLYEHFYCEMFEDFLDTTAQILKENKDKREAEFNERFKHHDNDLKIEVTTPFLAGPPKALDEDESEFLDKLEMSRREYEHKVADEEAQELQRFQAAVAAQGTNIQELKETTVPVPKVQDKKLARRKNPSLNPLGVVIKVKAQAKKAKIDPAISKNIPSSETPDSDRVGCPDGVMANDPDNKGSPNSAKTDEVENDLSLFPTSSSLVSYSESDDDS